MSGRAVPAYHVHIKQIHAAPVVRGNAATVSVGVGVLGVGSRRAHSVRGPVEG